MAYGPVSVGVKETRTSTTDKTLSVAGGYADAKAISDGAANKIRLAGDTLTGDLSFSGIGDTAKSNGLSWNGSTDGADIYYQTTAKDQGNLVINLRDDSDCYLRIAKNGAFKSYFSPDDGNFHGNVNGRADTAGVADVVKTIPWAKLTGKPDVPSGGIVASILNSQIYVNTNATTAELVGVENGIRFSDGTQICWVWGRGGSKLGSTIHWPLPFANTDYYVNCVQRVSGISGWPYIPVNKTVSSVPTYIYQHDYIAIGRWK